ncbi:MAG: LL-diaminopimelate aminotransferase [Chlamydiae bacterium]|nr:LL-diaminopimelate aminotransferase [Chlamydiota bacterium]
MAKGNPNFERLRREYIFPIIEKKLLELKELHPDVDVINVGIGDISLPLASVVVSAISSAAQEMAHETSIRGYGPSEGYKFLKQCILENEYQKYGLSPEEIFISDGINTDIANALELFASDSRVAIPDPTYPVYLDSTLISGNNSILLPCLEANQCLPKPPKEKVDIIYLCSPSNPTGVAMNYDQLKEFVDYAIENESIILFDSAYSAFIHSSDVPKSVYEIPGAENVAIEFRSFSKSAGFTGLRCGYTVVPKKILLSQNEEQVALWNLWSKRQSIKSNGVSYPIQRGAESCFTPEGKKQISYQIDTYLESAKAFREGLAELGYTCYGGVDSPYIWWKIPGGFTSWEFFDILLKHCHIVAIPGRGFGEHGEGFIRLSAFTKLSKVRTALERIKNLKL